jgi:outer membrane protein OmpA-like peptidoglycan-associated protein
MSDLNKIIGSTKKSSNTIWMTTTDLMSGLMIVFMFIAISYMVFLDRKTEKTYEIVKEWDRSKQQLVEALHNEFDRDLKKWSAEIDDDDISIKFIAPEILFKPAKSYIKPQFRIILNDFYPRYLKVLADYKEFIAEIRIEGHTSKEWKSKSNDEAYLLNMKLSQDRSRSVLRYIVTQVGHKISKDLNWAKKRITANGLSSSNLYIRKGTYYPKKSRRVEFKVRTNAEKRIELILAKR